MKKYSLLNKKTQKLVEFDSTSNTGIGPCVDVMYTLCENGEQVWLVDSYETANIVHSNPSTPWYNAGYETPNYNLDMNDYEVVEVHIFVAKV